MKAEESQPDTIPLRIGSGPGFAVDQLLAVELIQGRWPDFSDRPEAKLCPLLSGFIFLFYKSLTRRERERLWALAEPMATSRLGRPGDELDRFCRIADWLVRRAFPFVLDDPRLFTKTAKSELSDNLRKLEPLQVAEMSENFEAASYRLSFVEEAARGLAPSENLDQAWQSAVLLLSRIEAHANPDKSENARETAAIVGIDYSGTCLHQLLESSSAEPRKVLVEMTMEMLSRELAGLD